MCRSVGGIQVAAQRCFCRQRSYQRDHARSRLVLIAEAKPVWARSVLPWVTRWESRVMLLSLLLFFSNPLLSLFSLFFLISSSHTHTHIRSLLHLVGWLVHLTGCFPLPPHPHTHSLFFFFGCVLLLLLPALTCSLHTHTHTHRGMAGWRTHWHTNNSS